MDFYIRCPNNRRVIAHKVEYFDHELKNIINNSKLSDREKEQKKAELINSLGFEDQCCKQIFISYPCLAERIL